MGKRKIRVDENKAPSRPDILPHVPQVDLQSKQALHMDAPDSSLKRSPDHELPHQNHGSSHRILLRHSDHPFGRHNSRRSSSNYSDASPSNWKGSKIFQKPKRIRSSSLGENPVYGDVRNMECRSMSEASEEESLHL